MKLVEKEVWVIVTKDRKMIAKGVPRNRYLVPIANTTDKKRILTYSSKGMAISGYRDSWFFDAFGYKAEDLEAVKAKMTLEIED